MSVESKPKEDPNQKAFEAAVAAGLFTGLAPATLVVFADGEYITSAKQYSDLDNDEKFRSIEGAALVRPLEESDVKTIHRGPRLARNRKIHL